MSFISDDSERPPRVLRRPQKKLSALTAGDAAVAPTMQEAEAVEPKKKRLSRRVSFADTCLVTEFKTDGYVHGDLTAAEVSSHIYPASTEAECPQLQQECPDRPPVLSDASIQSLLTAPLATAAAFSGDGRVPVVLHAETTDVYEKPITGEMSSSSEESRQTTGYNTRSIRGDGHSAASISTMLSDRPDRQFADATVYDVDASMQLTMCGDHHGVWNGADDRAAQPEAPDCTVRFCDESMEMTMAEHKPIEVLPMTDCSNIRDGAHRHYRWGSPASAGSHLPDFQVGYLNKHDESEKENVCSAYGTLKADVRPTVAPSRVSGRNETSDRQAHVDLPSIPLQPSCDVAFSQGQIGSTTTLSTPNMDLTAVASRLTPEVDDREVTKFGEVSMDMTVPVEALIQMGQRGERSFRRPSAASETRYFADANMSMASANDLSPLPLGDSEWLDAGSAAAEAAFAREMVPHSDAASTNSVTTSEAALVEQQLSPAETECAALCTAAPPSEECDDEAAAAAAVEDLCSATVASSPPHGAAAVIEHSPTADGVAIDRRSTSDTLNFTERVSAPAAGGLDSAGQQEQSDTSRAQLGATVLEGGDLLFSKDSFSIDQHGSRMLSCHSDSTRSLLDAGRSHLHAGPLGHPRTGEVTVELCFEDTAYLLRDSIRVAIDEVKEEQEENVEQDDDRKEEKKEEEADENREEKLEPYCSVSEPTAGFSQQDISMEIAVADVSVPVTHVESAKHGLVNLPDDSDIIELALTKLHLRHDEARTEPGSAFVSSMSALLRHLCSKEWNDAFDSSNSSSDVEQAESMRSLHNTYVMQPLEAQLRLACDQLVHHRSCLQLETEALKKQLCLSIAEPATRDSDAGDLLRQVLAAGADELPELQEEFRSHHDRLHTVIEAKYDEWLFKCIRNIDDCWMESTNLLDTYLTEINVGIGQITQKLQDGEELEKALDAHIQMLQQKRLLEQPTTDELQRYATQQQELDKANQEVLERTKALEALLNTKRDLGRRKDELERVYTENVQKLKNQAIEKPSADVTTLKSEHASSASPSDADHFPSGAEMTGLHSLSCLDLDSFRAWTLESVTADVVTVAFLDGSVTLSIAVDSASTTTSVDERPIANVEIASTLSESCGDAASLAVNGVIGYFNKNQIASKYRGSQLIKEMLLEMSSVAAHIDELVAEIMDARLRRDCVISKLHDVKREHLVRLEVSFHNIAAATKFWLLLDFDVLLYPNATFCITFEEDLGMCSNSHQLETVASSVRPGLHYLSRLIECVSIADASDQLPDKTTIIGKS